MYGMKKKKTRTPQQQIRRGKTALALLGVMLVVYLASLAMIRCSSETVRDEVEEAMDMKLDSLLRASEYEDAEVTSRKAYKLTSITPPTNAEDTLFILKSSMEVGVIEESETEATAARIAELEERIREYNNDAGNRMTYYSRRINFSDAEGDEYTCIQTMDTNLRSSILKHIVRLDEMGPIVEPNNL